MIQKQRKSGPIRDGGNYISVALPQGNGPMRRRRWKMSDQYFFEYYVPTTGNYVSAKQASKFFGSEALAVTEAQRRLAAGKIISATLLVVRNNQVKYVRKLFWLW